MRVDTGPVCSCAGRAGAALRSTVATHTGMALRGVSAVTAKPKVCERGKPYRVPTVAALSLCRDQPTLVQLGLLRAHDH
eukprot:6485936-Prymnesium_polylepis.1